MKNLRGFTFFTASGKKRYLGSKKTAINNLTADLLPTREVPCAWPAPALAGWYCHLGVLPLMYY
jgi:hypothetical protein